MSLWQCIALMVCSPVASWIVAKVIVHCQRPGS